LLLIQGIRKHLEAIAVALAQLMEQVQQGKGILAAGQAYHHPIAFLDHVVVGDGLAQIMEQLLFQLVDLGQANIS